VFLFNLFNIFGSQTINLKSEDLSSRSCENKYEPSRPFAVTSKSA
jgi:hypothetical protein